MKVITQTQIARFEECRRLYFLKWVNKLIWPVEVGSQKTTREGADFHLLIRQLILGFPAESLIIPEEDEKVKHWLEIYLSEQPLGKPDRVYAEKDVSAAFADVLWLGKFDALAIIDDQLIIYDWKTGKAKADPEHYRLIPQTRLYRFLAKTCGARLLGVGPHAVPAENIEMVYWFPEHPGETIRLRYSEEQYQQDITYLKTMAAEMNSVDIEDYPKTDKERQCDSCQYRTYCFPGTFTDIAIPEEEDFPDDDWQPELFPADIFGGDQEETSF